VHALGRQTFLAERPAGLGIRREEQVRKVVGHPARRRRRDETVRDANTSADVHDRNPLGARHRGTSERSRAAVEDDDGTRVKPLNGARECGHEVEDDRVVRPLGDAEIDSSAGNVEPLIEAAAGRECVAFVDAQQDRSGTGARARIGLRD
jgi:hypothetical protein